MTTWTLIVLFLPLVGDGPIVGWTQEHQTQETCQIAMAHTWLNEMEHYHRMRLTKLVARCTENR